MSGKPTRDEIMEMILRINLLAARRAAGITKLVVAMSEMALAAHRLGSALRAADRRDEAAFLFEHPDVIDLDMADAFWRPE